MLNILREDVVSVHTASPYHAYLCARRPRRHGTHFPHVCAWHSSRNALAISTGHKPGGLDSIRRSRSSMETLEVMEETAVSIMETADCAIGYEAANMVYKGLIGYRDDYVEHIY